MPPGHRRPDRDPHGDRHAPAHGRTRRRPRGARADHEREDPAQPPLEPGRAQSRVHRGPQPERPRRLRPPAARDRPPCGEGGAATRGLPRTGPTLAGDDGRRARGGGEGASSRAQVQPRSADARSGADRRGATARRRSPRGQGRRPRRGAPSEAAARHGKPRHLGGAGVGHGGAGAGGPGRQGLRDGAPAAGAGREGTPRWAGQGTRRRPTEVAATRPGWASSTSPTASTRCSRSYGTHMPTPSSAVMPRWRWARWGDERPTSGPSSSSSSTRNAASCYAFGRRWAWPSSAAR